MAGPEDDKPKDFARLEVHGGRQILAELHAHDETGGPALRYRRDSAVTVEVTLGPWADDDTGWATADKVLAEADLAAIAEQLDAAGGNLIGGARHE